MKNFAIIGAGGYIAPRHLEAIQQTGHKLVAALDKHDSVGILDRYFPEAEFFTEFERFDRHIEKLKRQGTPLDYLVVCSPNYLHDAHIRFGLRASADVICEKPVVLNPWNVDALMEMEGQTGKKVFTILQLRLHPVVKQLRERFAITPKDKLDVRLNYITARGHWYHHSWKGDVNKSGGIATNIGLHFFDILLWIFGSVTDNVVHEHTNTRANGILSLEHANVQWSMSIDAEDLPKQVQDQGKRSYRSLEVNGEHFDLSDGFTDLHNLAYKEILEGNGIPLKETRPVIDLVHRIRKYL